MKVLALREKFQHMGSHSGYDLLFSALEKNPSVQLKSTYFSAREKLLAPQKALYRYIKKKYIRATPYYHSVQNVAAEMRAILMAGNCDLLHVGFLENNYGLLRTDFVRRRLSSTRIIATAHQPASWWRLNADPQLVDKLDALIVLTPVEQAYFEQFLPGRVFCVAHGVDTNFFAPTRESKREFRCVFSGQWLRDIPTLIQVVERVIQNKPAIRFDLIVSGDNRMKNYELYRLAKYPQVVWHQKLSDDELKRIYQNASVLLLPLLDCTANNALLEGMSCGLPVVSTRLEALDYYAPPKATFLFGCGEENQMAARIVSLAEAMKPEYGLISREHVLANFQWSKVADEMFRVYQQVCAAN